MVMELRVHRLIFLKPVIKCQKCGYTWELGEILSTFFVEFMRFLDGYSDDDVTGVFPSHITRRCCIIFEFIFKRVLKVVVL